MGGQNKIQRGAKFDRVQVMSDEVEIQLANGVKIHISSRVGQYKPGFWEGRVNVSISGIGASPDSNVSVSDQSSHGLRINYPLSKD